MEKEKLIKCKVRFYGRLCGDHKRKCPFQYYVGGGGMYHPLPYRCNLFGTNGSNSNRNDKCIKEFGLIEPEIRFQITGLPELAKQLQETVESINKTFRIAFENHLESSPPSKMKYLDLSKIDLTEFKKSFIEEIKKI